MTTRTIFFDESGFTGYNLLDPEQPVFTVASADIEDARAEEILRLSFPRNRADEHHFTRIWKSKRHRDGLRTFCNHLDEVADKAFCYATNKRFAVLTKIMDYLVEPAITDAGFDFYDDGFCWRYSNYVHFGLTQFAPPELLDCLLAYYQEFSRDPTRENLSTLQLRLRMMANSADERVQVFLDQMAMGAELFERYTGLEDFRSSNNIQTSTMIAVIGHWRQAHPEDFAVVHDASSAFLRDRVMWEAITAADNQEVELKAGDGSFVPHPLRVVSTEARDSRESFSIQFCDILAGLTAKHFNPDLDDDERAFMNELIGEGLGNISSNRLVPSGEFPIQIPPKRLEGPDVVDQMAALLRDRLG
ncbi:DUF3800 domain-containing protein [Roseobacter sinensis]|uniref:DUF3800 domain-containing protein n=1 Tax=Roseobacter sinensis TaxID=2931391 RepID=A0ABT3BEF7_9RHOB|nr:DUF3800 domain-containing protein [Roseobacter sp. WL0113]MCV3271954.1 DUF3800 domain-containing protein [Roseobacter sp. WL0113]